ncbi:MAG TPA: ribonuclease P protein component [Candidatus Sulfotelmatobacter sp.]|jgi:ribonuclease P protein component|nr:ribonuclease P protein component [Candidatus Sulfotelmatobacter sp.]
MLERKYRLPATTNLFQAHYARAQLFSVKYVQNNLQVSRFAFIVRKTVDKRAVTRNRIRRVFRSCIEELLKRITPGYDMLFFLEKGIIDKQQEDLCQELQVFLQQKQVLL